MITKVILCKRSISISLFGEVHKPIIIIFQNEKLKNVFQSPITAYMKIFLKLLINIYILTLI